MTTTTMKWTCTPDGQWVRRPFDLTITSSGKSDRPTPAPITPDRKIAA